MLPSSDRPLRPEGGAGPFWRLFVHGRPVRLVGLVAGPKFDATLFVQHATDELKEF